MKYLHFITKDQFYSKEFIDLIHSNFKIDEHKFIIIKEKNKKSHINPKEYQNIELFSISTEENVLKFIVYHVKFFTIEYLIIIKIMKQAEYILIHCLTEQISFLLFLFRGKTKILWVIWGYDLYRYLPIKYYDQHTSELKNALDSKIKSILKKIYYTFQYEIRKAVIKKINYFLSIMKGDIILVNKFFKTKAQWLKFLYPNPIDFEKLDRKGNYWFNKKFSFKKENEKLLLVGNSGASTNNHLDLFLRLSKMKEQNFKIICPLSYGQPKYIKKIIEKGKNLFGNRFIPLFDFLKPEEYYHILKQIDLAIFYHNRQQGFGTINILLYLEKPICMKKTSIFFHLLEIGILVYSSQDLEKLIHNEILLKKKNSENNKKITIKSLSKNYTIKSIKRIYK